MKVMAVGRRELRLGSGLVMFAYVAIHFVDHALGLVSLDAAERALRLSVAVWQSRPGSVLLYGAAAVHVGLALVTLYERRTLRMPAVQALRIALGLTMPVLLIGHAVGTRVATEMYQLAPTYHRVVWSLWLADGEGRQLALQAPGWMHGCLGLHLAFGHRRGWQRLRWPLFGAALLLPVLAALGFLAMGRELASIYTSAGAPTPVPDAPTRVALGRLRDVGVAAWFGLAALPFGARALRGWIERRRRLLVSIAYPRRTVAVPRGWSVLEASRAFGIPHLSLCGGNARCSTCRVRVHGANDGLPAAADAERRTLDRIGAPPDVRLACQLRPTTPVAVEPLLDPQLGAARVDETAPVLLEGEMALVTVGFVGPITSSAAPIAPADWAYAIDRLLAAADAAVVAAGGRPARFDAEGMSATFAHGANSARAAREALSAARALSRNLGTLGKSIERDVGLRVTLAMAVHLGPMALAALGRADARCMLPVGEAVRIARALREHAAASGVVLLVSRPAAEAAGAAPPAAPWISVRVSPAGEAIDAFAFDAAGPLV